MRSAQLTTSPSGVDGAGRDQLWLAMPSTVSAHRLSGARETDGAPRRVVEPAGHVGVERVLAGVPARPVPAVVPEGDGLGEGHVEPAGPGDGRGDLRHLERVGEAGALVVLGEDEDLGLAGQPAERGGVEDAVAVALEAGAPGIGLLGLGPVAGVRRAGGAGRQQRVLELLALRPRPLGTAGAAGRPRGRPRSRPDAGVRVGVGQADRPGVAGHRRCPAGTALRLPGRGRAVHVLQSAPSL